MPQVDIKIHSNTFEKGLNFDVDSKRQPPGTYRKAVNIDILSDGENTVIRSRPGTSLVKQLIDGAPYPTSGFLYSYGNVLAIKHAKFYVTSASAIRDCVVVFLVKKNTGLTTQYFEIHVYDTIADTVTVLYSKEVGSDYLATKFDSFVFSEGGIDSIYFTDQISEPKKLRCVLPSSGQLTDREIDLLRRYPGGNISITDILYNQYPSGGSGDRTFYYENQTTIDTLTQKKYNDDLLLNLEQTTGDQFKFDVDWSWSLTCQSGVAKATALVTLLNQAGGTIFSEGRDYSAPLFPHNESGSGTELNVTCNSGAYNATPFKWELNLQADITGGDPPAAYVHVSASLEIKNIQKVAGTKTYYLGSPTVRSKSHSRV